jgi:hypothetical protein
MTGFHAHADPPRTLGERLEQLNDNLHNLSLRLKDAIAAAVSTAVGEAIRDGIRNMLGRNNSPARDEFPQHESDLWNDPDEALCNDDEDAFLPRERESFQPPRKPAPNRLGNALSMALQTAIWWTQQQPRRRPVLTTTLVAVAAGITAFIAGPILAAGVGVLASAAGLLMTANTVNRAGDQLRTLATG